MTLLRRTAVAALVLAAVLAVAYPLHRSRTYQLFGEIVPRVETTDSVVALTFDDGPTASQADEVLDYLRANRLKATFYVTGSEVVRQPEVARRLVADGHELGNHTFSHRAMILRSPGFIRAEVERTDSAIRSVGFRGPITFRPPYTKKLFGLPLFLARTGRVTVTWDVEPESFAEVDGDTERIARHVLERVRPGSIILLHPWYRSREASRRAVPAIVEGLRARGYKLVTVGELRASELAATTAQSPPAGTRAGCSPRRRTSCFGCSELNGMEKGDAAHSPRPPFSSQHPRSYATSHAGHVSPL